MSSYFYIIEIIILNIWYDILQWDSTMRYYNEIVYHIVENL